MRNNNLVTSRPLAAAWGRLLLGLCLLLVAAGCSSNPANIGVGLPSVDAGTGAYLVDTLTVRTSTVLRDSVVTSNSSYLLVGRYLDPILGPIKATSYTNLSLGGIFQPDQTFIADSVVLVLPTETYRYGDTTQTQTLLNVRELSSYLPATSYAFASPKLTSMTGRLSPTAPLLNYKQPVVQRRARKNLGTLRLRLSDAYRDRLMNDGKRGQLTSQELLDRNYAGLALQASDTDAGALVRCNVAGNAGAAGVILYYHDPIDVLTALSHTFSINDARHFYQVEAPQVGTGTTLPGLTTSLRNLESAKTGEQTYIHGLLGLQTKIEIPYLFDLRNFGQHFIITSAAMTAEVPAATLSTRLALAPPATLTVSTTDKSNHQGTVFTTATYRPEVTNRDGITQAGYTWSVLAYCQNVLNGVVPNDGMLLATSTPAQPERVVVGSPKRTTNRLQLRLYLISNGQ